MGAVRSMLRRAAGWREFHCVLGVGLAVLSTSLVVAPADAAETTLVAPVKIMPLGDSITHGVGASGGYRLELKDLLVPAGYSFDFVGSRNSGPYEIEDRQHEGNSGYKIHDIAAIARNRVTTYRPDIVLLVIGTNDVWTDYELDSAPARLGGLIDTIVDAAPAASVIVGSIPPLADSLDDAQARTYNAAVPGVVQARADAGKKVSFVDMYGAMTLADLYDGVHPNADGYFKMADVWRPALEAILPSVPSTGSPNCPCSAWSAGQSPVVSQVSSTSPTEVGVRFRVEQYGYITGVRFFKGPLNTGTHKGSLWARDGRLLASATFTNETASGWQQVNFSSPVVVWPWTTYVASYFAPVGRYAADPAVFTQTEIVSSPVRLLAAGQSGGNGWTLGTSTGGFPNVPSSQAANYWVDVVFSPSADPAPPTPPPSAPGNLRVTGTSSSQISLAWNDVVGETGFRVERAPGGTTNWASVAIVPRDNWVFTDTGLAASTTYKYRIIATSRNGDSAPSAVVTATTAALPPPVAPGGVTAVAVSPSQIDVAWLDVAGESGYRVQRSLDGVTGWVQVGTTGQDVVSWSDMGLAASTAYFYRVVASNGSGDSAPSAVVTATTAAPPAPVAPGGVTAVAVSPSQVDVAWLDVAGESGYRVQRSPDGLSGWVQVGTTGQDVVSFSDTGLAVSTTYFYRVVAGNSSGDSPPSAVVSATTAAPPPPPAPEAPAGVTAVAVSSSQVDVAWQDVAGESGYRVQRSLDGVTGWVQVGTTGQDVVSFSDTGLAASTTYFYRVVASNGSGDSAPSAVVNATTATPPPEAPAGVTAVAVASSQVDVAWLDVAGESGYAVQRSPDGLSGWVQVGTTGQDVVSFSDTGLAVSTTYFYRVVASNSSGDSPPSAGVSATTAAPPPPPAPEAPGGVTAVAVSSSQVDVAWQDVAGESGYAVERSLDGVSGWDEIGTTGQDVVSFSDTGLAASTTYFYRVVASNGSGDSAPSAVVTATTPAPDTQPPSTPTKLKATVAKSKVNLTWTGSTDSGSGVAGYRVYRSSTGLEGSFTLLITTASTSASVQAPSGVALWYRVTAYDVAGNESVPSPAVRAVAR